jgi:hypothetical protein
VGHQDTKFHAELFTMSTNCRNVQGKQEKCLFYTAINTQNVDGINSNLQNNFTSYHCLKKHYFCIDAIIREIDQLWL